MLVSIEQILYTDPQAQVPAGECAICGGALYRPGLYCTRCGGEQP